MTLGTYTRVPVDEKLKVSELPRRTEAERQQILVAWNDTYAEFPQEKCIHQLFEEQVEKTPDNIAVLFEDQSLTYRELNARANQLAHHLRTLGVGPDLLVGICIERSLEMIVGLLGILKAGGGYVPIDPDYPQERIAFMFEDANPIILLTQQHLQHLLPTSGFCLDSQGESLDKYPKTNLENSTLPSNMAYVIYTSGSTGQPKGVLIAHQGISNVSMAQQRLFSIHSTDRILQIASLNFDASIFEIIMALLTGSSLYLAKSEKVLPGPEFPDLIKTLGITIITTTPAALTIINPENLPTLRLISVAGEACPAELVSRWGNGRRFFNLYGPTEGTIWATAAELGIQGNRLPHIGRPIQNIQTYILGEDLCLVPIGIPGELCIAGVGLARGYLNQPKLTAEKFVPNPFSAEPGARMYRTGDLVRWLPDGNIEFLGRIDHQVKIRGFRVELGEIETVLAQHPGMRQVVVLAREDTPGEKRLVAYITSHTGQDADAGELRIYLKSKLPDYMVPSAFVFLETLPLSANGKIDRNALPMPDYRSAAGGYVAPGTPTEETLANIWAEVLKLERVGIHDNFFELGGNSLSLIQLFARVREAFKVELPLTTIFNDLHVAKLTQHVEKQQLTQAALELPPIKPAPRDLPIPASFQQEAIWFLNQLTPNNLAYNAQCAIHLDGELSLVCLDQAFTELVRRHEILRTTFHLIDDQLVQSIHEPMELTIPCIDLQTVPTDEQTKMSLRHIGEVCQTSFDIQTLPLMRWVLIRLSADRHILVIVEHHFVHDGWSTSQLLRELQVLYDTFVRGERIPLAPPPIQYADFAFWQRQMLRGEFLERQLTYWTQQLAQSPWLKLPTDHLGDPLQPRGAEIQFEVSESLNQALQQFSRRQGVTLFTTMLTAFNILLSRYTGQTDILVGTGVANRRLKEMESMLGMVVNTLVLRTNLANDPPVKALLQQVQQMALDAYTHSDLPFHKLVAELRPERYLGQNPLFRVMFAFHDSPMPELKSDTLHSVIEYLSNNSAKVDMNLIVIPRHTQSPDKRQTLLLKWEYRSDLFDETTITRMIKHYQVLLTGMVQNPEIRLSELPILTDCERQQILVGWNNRGAENPQEKCIHQLFEEQVKKTPDNIAVVFEDQSLTYRQLNARANQLAHYLQKQGVGPDVLVGVCVDRSLEMVLGLLGILKAGGAYVPIDPAYPQERIAFMLANAQTHVLLTQEHLLEQIPKCKLTILLDRDREAFTVESPENLKSDVIPENLAYVIYTSGSTGEPKGSMITHLNVTRLLFATDGWFHFGPKDSWTLFHSFSFDFSVWEIWGALAYGGRLIVVPYLTSRSPLEFYKLVCQTGVTVLNQTPSAFRQLIAAQNKLPDLHHQLRVVIFGGEALEPVMLRPWYHDPRNQTTQMINMYGITETTVHVTYRPLETTDIEQVGSSPIGYAIPDLKVYLLNAQLQPVPIGVAGEMFVGGAGLARGYLNCSDLTAERFVPNSFSTEPGARMYRTGDLARWLPDGNIEFLGRIDHQVKIRGFRIELGEIEAVLGQHPGVREVVVLAREDTPGEKRLVAYLASHSRQAIDASNLRAHLKSKLPDYMIPSAFVLLEALPLTPNGKTDRKALPAPDYTPAANSYVAPTTTIEETLANIWAEVLKLERVGIHDNFFELGGHSLLATQIISRIHKAFGIDISVHMLFNNSTIKDLGLYIDEMQTLVQKVRSSHIENTVDHEEIVL